MATNKSITQSDETKYRFGRSSNRKRTVVKIPFTSDAKDDVPDKWVYDATKNAYEQKKLEAVEVSLLQTTRVDLGLSDTKYSGNSKGTKGGGKVWKVVKHVEDAKPSTAKLGERPNGKPAKVTTYNIPVPTFMNAFLFANSIYAELKKNNKVFIASSSKSNPDKGDIVAFISPSGISWGTDRMEALLKRSESEPRENSLDAGK